MLREREHCGAKPLWNSAPGGFSPVPPGVADGGFEYWIGMFLPQDAPVPEGYEHMGLPEETCALFWIYGMMSPGGRTPRLRCSSPASLSTTM